MIIDLLLKHIFFAVAADWTNPDSAASPQLASDKHFTDRIPESPRHFFHTPISHRPRQFFC
jgi:hypothetical protein